MERESWASGETSASRRKPGNAIFFCLSISKSFLERLSSRVWICVATEAMRGMMDVGISWRIDRMLAKAMSSLSEERRRWLYPGDPNAAWQMQHPQSAKVRRYSEQFLANPGKSAPIKAGEPSERAARGRGPIPWLTASKAARSWGAEEELREPEGAVNWASPLRCPQCSQIIDMGPLHDSVKAHMRKLLKDPSLLLSSAPDAHTAAALDGKPWSDVKAWADSECVRLAPSHTDVRPLILAGLESALECFERVTTEFAPGGLIDQATAAERLAAHMPSTNDANEGLLGMWRRFSRESPSSTVGHFADQAMFHRNETQDFLDIHMNTAADQEFLRQEARRVDESGVEKARREELNAHKQEVVDEKRAKDAETAEKKRKESERLTAIGVELDRSEIDKMTDPQLKDQLELHRRKGDKEVPMKSKLKRKGDRLAALLAAMDRLEESLSSVDSTESSG
ncbi:hypothetical protein DFH06DRAFT_1293815 [Mycena polygramma]|nr:hypothetical protein DFH06DRAFT_1293815 [Mycena polygramma]